MNRRHRQPDTPAADDTASVDSTGPMLSPARAHLQRMAAAAAQAAAPTQPSAASHEHQLLLAQLYEHRKQLKAIQSVERKVDAKGAMVPVYDDYIAGVLEADQGGDDPIVTTLMVWNIDAARYHAALQIADYVLRHGLKLPDQYQRDPATLLMDEFSSAALAGKLPPDGAAALLTDVLTLTQDKDAPDQARAKLHKAIGYALLGKSPSSEPDLEKLDDATASAAHVQLLRANELFAGVGVKKDLERLERRLKKAADATPPN